MSAGYNWRKDAILLAILALLTALLGIQACRTSSVSFQDVLVTPSTPTGAFLPYPSNPVPLPNRTNTAPPFPGELSKLSASQSVIVTPSLHRSTNVPCWKFSWDDPGGSANPSVEYIITQGRADGVPNVTNITLAPTNFIYLVPFSGPAWICVQGVASNGLASVPSTNLYLDLMTNWPVAVSPYTDLLGRNSMGWTALSNHTYFVAAIGSTNWLWSDTPTSNRLEQFVLPSPLEAMFHVGRTD